MSTAEDRLRTALADRYRIERELGAGGMATVYLAEDVKHHRQVAIKVLRPELASALGPERFVLEIETTANLRHPHILPLYDSGEADGFLFYVMPFVEGESLRDRLDRERQLPLDDALQIAREVADALNYAHGRGVIHRDIKPENILLESGRAVVADFGIAKAVSAAGGERLTGTGMSVGTPQYMSPEQAAGGGELDGRSDEYALGCVLFEMLAGQPPFSGPTVASVVHQHLATTAPQVTQLRPAVPADVAAAIARALAKSPADRFHPLSEFSDALRRSSGQTPLPSVIAPRSRRGRYLVAALCVLGALMAVWSMRGRRGSAVAPTVSRTDQLTRDPGLELDPAISPDGQLVAYASGPVARMQIFVRQVAGGRTVQLTSDTSENHRWPRWSPDGSRIAYQSERGIAVVPALGGAPRLLARAPRSAFKFGSSFTPLVGLTWAPDGRRIAYAISESDTARIFIVGDDGTTSDTLPAPPDANSPAWSPDGKHIAIVSGNITYTFGSVYLGNVGAASIWSVPVDGGPLVRVTDAANMNASPQWSPDSRALLFVSDRGGSPDIFHIAVDGDGAPVGNAERVTAGANAHSITVSADGRHLAYAQLRSTSNVWSLPIPRSAPVSAADAAPVTTGNQFIENLDVTWDGAWVAFASDLSGQTAIYKVPASGGEPIRLTNDSVVNFAPSWSPDGGRIAYHRISPNGHREVYVMNADGTDRQLRTSGIDQALVPSWSPTGDSLVVQTSLAGNQRVAIVPSSGPQAARFVPLDVGGDMIVWSPTAPEFVVHAIDGVRIASPAGGASRLVASNAADGVEAFYSAWSRDGSALYYLARGKDGWMIRTVSRTGGASRVLVRFDDPSHQPARYGFRTDGRRFFLTMGSNESDLWVIALGGR